MTFTFNLRNPFKRAVKAVEETLEQRQRRNCLLNFNSEERPLVEALAFDHVCPDCRGDKFTMGPQGGMGQNIKCSNEECGSEFCVGPFEDGTWIGYPMMARRTNRSEADSQSLYGRGYGPKHPVPPKPEVPYWANPNWKPEPTA